ncbi:hypothetical protein PR048_027490 [Dryococelus australis]|uniref:Uncharacterized protein n=1 Tax=Dryococelus australis TaxID=614101 RepID=A0ABQ9GGN6_9NEOP|nr:hypothetical protein PR048_027490 [Dryococelus australis]
MTPANLIARFRGIGIYPYHCSILPGAAFAPSKPKYTEREVPMGIEEIVEATNSSSGRSDSEPCDRKILNSSRNLEVIFQDLLSTSNLHKGTKAQRRPAINYRAQSVGKSLFRMKRPTAPREIFEEEK